MKKLFFIISICLLFLNITNAQTRNCGTTAYQEMLLKLDPAAEQRMVESEIKLQEWIKQHPETLKNNPVIFPEIEGFVPTGNEALDQANYAEAKSKLIFFKAPRQEISTEKRKELQAKKRIKNTLKVK
jgi:hypothetical protein